jgi:hypothetical protein
MERSLPGTDDQRWMGFREVSISNGVGFRPAESPLSQSLKFTNSKRHNQKVILSPSSTLVMEDLLRMEESVTAYDESTGYEDNQHHQPTIDSGTYNSFESTNKQDGTFPRSVTWPQYTSYSQGLASLIRDIQRLCEKHNEAIALRILNQQMRKQMAVYRERINKWDSKLIRFHHQASEGSVIDFGAVSRIYNKAQNARNRSGPIEDTYQREELELGKLEISIVNISERIERNFKRFRKITTNDDEHSEFEASSKHTASAAPSSTSFQTDPAEVQFTNLSIIGGSDVGSIEARHTHWRVPSLVSGENGMTQENPFGSNFVSQSLNRANLTVPEYLYEEKSSNEVPSIVSPTPDRKTPSDFDAMGTWNIVDAQSVTETLPSISPRNIIATNGPFAFSKASLSKIDNPHWRVNDWLLDQLLASVLEWLLFESELEAALPHTTSVSEEFWEMDFQKTWDSDEAAERNWYCSSFSVTQSLSDGPYNFTRELVY